MANPLSSESVLARLATHPGWTFEHAMITRTFDRGDFNGSIGFINAIAAVANRLDHHPDLEVSWNDVTVRTASHDIDGISERDFALIAAIDELAGSA